ncbi:MAG: DUF3460 family protein [Polaromonas sp.]|jgi:hypothetical protein|nr:DUF3460 family protein [Polaromonas sp.]
MSIFRRPDYTSEVTQFIESLKAQKPTLEAEQREGRAIWWDQKIDRSAEQDYQEARVEQQSYVYQTDHHPNAK